MQSKPTLFFKGFILIILLFNLISCGVTKGLEDGQSILVKNEIYVNGKKSSNETLYTYLKQQPKSSYFGLKHSEVLFSKRKLHQSEKQLNLYFKNKSFFNNTVYSEYKTKRKRTKVKYHITTNTPYKIDSINYNQIHNSTIKDLILDNPNEKRPKNGDNYDYWILEKERNHIYNTLIENGYYTVNKSDLGFYADTINRNNTVGLEYFLDTLTSKKLLPYQFNNITIKLLSSNKEINNLPIDTIRFGNITLITPRDEFPINNKTLESCILFSKGDYYKRSLVDNTFSKLNNLNVFERIRITLNENSDYTLDCNIEMYKRKKIANTYSLEGIHTTGNYGLSGNFIYEDRNLFRGAEALRIKINGIAEHQGAEEDKSPIFNSFTYGSDLSLSFPKILSPVNIDMLLDPSKRVNTVFAFGYNRLDRPSLGRTIINFKAGYQWQERRFKHLLNLTEISSVYIDEDSDLSGQSGTNIQQLYSNFLITSTNYAFEYTDQDPKKIEDHNFIRGKIELSGNILGAIAETTNLISKNEDGFNILYKNIYTQFAKFDFDVRHYFVFDNNHQIAGRFLFGIGIPYGNSTAMPFQKQYFVGGSNDIRGFNSYSIGPGSYPGTSTTDFYTADLKLGVSLEYRFTISKGLKGALFVDAGNIWELKQNKDDDGNILKPGAQFQLDRFSKEIASSIGFGFRYDMEFLVFRVDLAHAMYDPSVGYINPNYDEGVSGSQEFLSAPISHRWKLNQLRLRDVKLGIGIGYPF